MGQAKQWSGLTGKELEQMDQNAIEKADPERYKAMIRMLQEGWSIKGISRAVGCSTRTVYKVMQQDPSLQKGIVTLTSKLHKSANQVLDRMVEVMDDDELVKGIGFKDLAVAAAVVTDKIDKLAQSQTPGTVNLTQININEAKDLNALLAGLPSEAPAETKQSPEEKSQVIDVTPVEPPLDTDV